MFSWDRMASFTIFSGTNYQIKELFWIFKNLKHLVLKSMKNLLESRNIIRKYHKYDCQKKKIMNIKQKFCQRFTNKTQILSKGCKNTNFVKRLWIKLILPIDRKNKQHILLQNQGENVTFFKRSEKNAIFVKRMHT